MSSGSWILINHWLEVNVEVNGLCWNDTTLPFTRNSGQELANIRLISTNKTTKKQEGCVQSNKSASRSPPWNSLGAKPKSKSFPWEMGRQAVRFVMRPAGLHYHPGRWPLQPLYSVGHCCGQLQKGKLPSNLPNNQVCNCCRTLDCCLMTWIISHVHTAG